MDFVITLNRAAATPLHRQLYEELRQAILNGRLLPQQRLPSTRSLATSLAVSRTTVTQGYDQLLSEGYLETVVGSGTFVCARLPDDLLPTAPVLSSPAIADSSPPLSAYGLGLADIELPGATEPTAAINFRYGRPALDRFPIKLWRKLLSRHCRAELDWLDYATDPLDDRRLREAIARYLAKARAIQCTAEQVMITNGTQQSLDLITRLFINVGEAIALEEPSYLGARRTFLANGARLVPIPVDTAGLAVDQLTVHASAPIKLVYVTPSHQFPTGAILSLPRRLELLAWAQQARALIIEDDYDSEYRYGSQPIPALQGLDRNHTVLYIGTFSKVLFPSLRMGYLVLPDRLVSTFARAKWLSDRQLPLLEQAVLADFIDEGHLERHIRQMRLHYDQRRQTLVRALTQQFGQQVTILGENAGIHLMVRLHSPLSDAEILQRAAAVNVGMMSAQPHYLLTKPPGEFIFGYGELSDRQIQDGIIRLATALHPKSRLEN
ncbi:PLP-dependent aminotransferase family protein [Oculatella sp. LEGE 06141]|uniref:MocR-like pyridoxine biosynthesis transcription factor PdxR n=1 Tax=Oculatella sp. LEGE 06141 TaxID=1828648 RepID=UPI00187E2F9A|nr:PLP-dependent aminotransferase family protein [Oculatella sp. LEGE 06141]MBE9178558.1 PLP-dependent aminotransferase family protein [Oculatella sp. LEGE 06141]